MKQELAYSIFLILALATSLCRSEDVKQGAAPGCDLAGRGKAKATAGVTPATDPCLLVLTPHSGDGLVDREIIRLQGEVPLATEPSQTLERLGWMFVAKARGSFDSAFYKLAEQCALCLDTRHPGSCEALLLRGHALHNLNRFREAEPLARELVAKRGVAFDLGLLGDILMERGRLNEAAEAYQKMIDFKPDLHSYARGAHVRWLKGNLSGALELMQMAASGCSQNDPETAAWIHTRLASYQFQAGTKSQAYRSCDVALDYQQNYPPALLLRGRMHLAAGRMIEAIEALQRAAQLSPLPEYQWALADALRAGGRESEAAAVESELRKQGALRDPRVFSLYLATRGEPVETAVRLAEQQLEERGNVFTHDALAWALARAGRLDEAQGHMRQALSEGTEDARFFFHAGIIAVKSGQAGKARQWLKKAAALSHLLLPSERQHLQAVATKAGEDLEPKFELPPPRGASTFPSPGNDFFGSGELKP